MKKISTAAIVAAAMSAFAVSDHSVSEFPRLPGEADDAPRFQRAVDACYGGGLLTVPGGNYTFARTLYVTNLCSIRMSPGARIKAVAEMDWMVKINQMWQFNPKTAPKDVEPDIYNLSFVGGTLDADGKASCLAVDNYRHFTMRDSTFLNGKRYGVAIETEGLGYEMIANNLYFKTLIPGLAGNTALYTQGGDSQYTDIIVIDYTVGIRVLYGGCNRFTRCHVWGGPVGYPAKKGELPEMLHKSVCFKSNGSSTTFRDCYADTGEIGFWIKGGSSQILGCNYYNNLGFGLRDVTVIRHDRGELVCDDNVFLGQTPETKLYSASSKAKVRWGANNSFKGFNGNAPYIVEKGRDSPGASAIDIGAARQLTLDDELIEKNTMKRVWHRPVRNPRSVAPRSLAGGVWYDGATRQYSGWTSDGAERMVSGDGLRWTVAKTGALRGFDRVRVTMDFDGLDRMRFKAFAAKKDLSGYVASSSDGNVWSLPVRAARGGDLAMAFYNPFTRSWGYSMRSQAEGGKGTPLDYHEADVFLGGARTRPPLRGGRLKPIPTPWLRESKSLRGRSPRDFGEFACVPYEGVLIGMAQVSGGDEKGSDIWFGFARNRWHWTFPKPTEGEAFIRQTRRDGDWDARNLVPTPGVCVVAGDELRFYYSGDGRKTGYATLRRDGFCSLQDGTLRTKRLVFYKGDRLWANVDARQGELIVRVTGQDGKNFGERKISGVDSTRLEIGAVEAGRPFVLEFVSSGGARLYSFWPGGADGRSGGYLAGGSPESETAQDVGK